MQRGNIGKFGNARPLDCLYCRFMQDYIALMGCQMCIRDRGNSGDACKIKSYDLNYQCIKGYGLMNW